MKRVRIGILGVGRGATLARGFAHAANAELAALCDSDEARLARAAAVSPGAATYTSYEAMLGSDLDAVLVASPMPLHVAHAVAALRAGKHVLTEVTAATSLEQCWELLETVRSTGRKYMLAENYCYLRPWSLVLSMARAGLLGELYYGEADQIQDLKAAFVPPGAPGASGESGLSPNWRTAELAMRQGHHYITHSLGPLYQALGERIATVVCLGSRQHHLPWARADDTCTVFCQTESGKLLRLRLDFFSNRPHNFTYFGLQGTGGCYEAPRRPQEPHKVYIEGRTPPGTWQDLWDFAEFLPGAWRGLPDDPGRDDYNGGLPLMISDFARCILEDTRPPIDVIDALNMTAPGLVSEISRQRGGAPVEVPRFG